MLSKKAMAAGNGVPSTDPDFEYVTMLLHGDGTNGAQNNTFIDGSTNNFTVTRNGNTTQGSLNPFGDRWSNYFDGSGDFLSIAANTALNITGGAFTIELWAFTNVSGLTQMFVTQDDGNSSGQCFQFRVTTSTVDFIYWTTSSRSSAVTLSTTANFIVGSWNHVAVSYTGSVLRIYINGVQRASSSVGSMFSANIATGIGHYNGTLYGEHFNGYISNVRIVKGTAVYTSNFTPPTAPLTAITNTSLLTCQSNRLIDNSSNNFTITRYGDVSVRPFSPFSPSAAYSTSTNGGSGYFDGNGDYLALPASNAFAFGTGDFTIELFAYRVSGGSSDKFFVDQNNSLSYLFRYNGSGVFQFFVNGNIVLSYTLTTWIGYWSHLVVVRTGTTISMFVDGVRVATGTFSSSIGFNSQIVGVGAKNTGGTDFFAGYISSLRIVQDDVYDATQTTLTVPTAPLTAITGTSLLLNFTNAGIFDNAAANVLETVGNAQISTSVKKYGTGSLAFDGTGDWLLTPDSPDLNMGTGDFTIEAWVNRTSAVSGTPNADTIIGKGTNNLILGILVSSGVFICSNYGVSVLLTGTTAVSNGVWYHVAVTRSGTTMRLFVNGVQEASATSSANFSSTTSLGIGVDPNFTTQRLNGYIDDLRITKGVARYTANFTPPTAAFPDL